jgi:hypothetical protein
MSVFNTTEKICLYITNAVFWLVIYAIIDDTYGQQLSVAHTGRDEPGDAVAMFFCSIFHSYIYILFSLSKEVKNGYKNLYR